MYLVDTNVLSEARRGSNEARIWLRSVDPATIYLSVVTLGEIMKGIALKHRTDARTAASLTVWLKQLRLDHGDRILPISDLVAQISVAYAKAMNKELKAYVGKIENGTSLVG